MYEVKRVLFFLSICFFVLGCSSLKPASSNSDSYNNQQKSTSIKFIDNISINPQYHNSVSSVSRVKPQQFNSPSLNSNVNYSLSAIETYSSLQFKYSILTDAPVEEMSNEKLLQFMDEWYGAKYHFGGNTKDGIDCSAFASLLMSSVYGITNLPRMAKDQYLATSRISKKHLREGDLVFFHTYGKKKKKVTHVGVYLCNNKFIHASVSGVMISDLGEEYYSRHFVGTGRATDLSVVSSK
jgi:lipoprotein Spr